MQNPKPENLPSNGFVKREFACPVCQQKSSHLLLSDHAYRVEKRDHDSFILQYKWLKPDLTYFHPYYFDFWHCPRCKFTDDKSVFIRNIYASSAKSKEFLNIYRSKAPQDTVIDLLSRHLNYPSVNYRSVLTLHLLATYIQLLPEDYQKNFRKIAQYYHRCSWIYRIENLEKERDQLEADFNEFMKKYELMRSNYMNTLASFEDIHQWLSGQISSEKQVKSQGWALQNEKIRNLYSDMVTHFDALLPQLQAYHDIGMAYKKYINEQENGELSLRFFSYRNYSDFLLEVQKFWHEIPITESMAIQRAIENYKELIRSEALKNEKLKLFKVYRMLIYLHEKLGDVDVSLEYAQKLSEMVGNFRKVTRRQLDRSEYFQQDLISESTLRRYIKKADEILSVLSEDMKRLWDKKKEADMDKAQTIFTANRNLSIEELKSLLIREGISKEVVAAIIHEKQKESKRGIFQIFRI